MYVSALSSYNSVGVLFRWDGVFWHEVNLPQFRVHLVRLDISSVIGSSETDIWICGSRNYYHSGPGEWTDTTFIAHFDGNSWVEIIPDVVGRGLTQTGVLPGGRFFFGGWDQTSYETIGLGIVRTPLNSYPSSGDITSDFQKGVTSVAGDGRVAYLTYRTTEGTGAGVREKTYLYSRKQDGWELSDTNELDFSSVWMSQDGTLYGTNLGVHQYLNGAWSQRMFSEDIRSLFGTTNSNILGVGYNGRLFHFNGVDWLELFPLSDGPPSLSHGWTNGREYFVTGTNGSEGFVLIGRPQ